jgi:hypothetical protein
MWHNIEQNADEWLMLRSGKVTGSAIGKIMANYGKEFGDPAKKLAVDIAIERITGKIVGGSYSNEHMERGHEQEPIARMLYEEEYFCDVTNGGFFDNGITGCSPDGLIGESGMIEIKSVIPSVQYKRVKTGLPDPAYKWQIAFNLRESGREWIDYVSFCAGFPEEKRLFVRRIRADQLKEQFIQIDTRLAEFEALVNQVKHDIQEAP